MGCCEHEPMRAATDTEKQRLIQKLGVYPVPPALLSTQAARLNSLEDFGGLRTSLANIGGILARAAVGREVFVVSELFETWSRSNDGFGHDLVTRYLSDAEDPAFEPMPLVDQVREGWRVVDGNHRAAAYFEFHRRRKTRAFSVDVFGGGIGSRWDNCACYGR